MEYNIDNWEELQKDIVKRAQIYPAKENGITPQGHTKYVQYVVMYGKRDMPANVKVVWAKENNSERMITAFIEEI